MTSDPCVEELAELLRSAQGRAVVFTGAGMSTDSGIPDFRSPHGVWQKYRPVLYEQFVNDAASRDEYWRQKSEAHEAIATAVPHVGYHALARWERHGVIAGIITQNIDRLHLAAGNQQVLELHGNAMEVVCLECEFRDDVGPWLNVYRAARRAPRCPRCQGPLKHATVSFGQRLPATLLQQAWQWAKRARLFVVVGSSLQVSPAAELPRVAREAGAWLVIINREPTSLDDQARAVCHRNAVDVLSAVDAKLGTLGPSGD